MPSEQVTKRRVDMSNPRPIQSEDGAWQILSGSATDYVRPDFLDAYVADAKLRWGTVEVSAEPDAGPAGYHGATIVPAQLDHELAGREYGATSPDEPQLDDHPDKPKPKAGGGKAGTLSTIVTLQLTLGIWLAVMVGAIAVLAQRNALATAYGTAAPYGTLFTADPGTSGTVTGELTGGSPAFARKAMSWGAASASAITGAPVFDVAAGTTVTYFGVCVSSTLTTADLRDKVAVTSQAFASQGTYTVTATYTQS